MLTPSEENLMRDWYKKRQHNLIIYTISKALHAFENSAIQISALYYFQNTIHVENPKLYYSLAMGALFLSATLSSIVIGRYMDHYRNLRRTALWMAWFNIVGNLIYLMPVFDWSPIFGRFLCGIADGIKPAYQG